MKALVHSGNRGLIGAIIRDCPEKTPGPGEVKVRVQTAGLNHRDLFVMRRRAEADAPLIIGSDGAGIVEAVGADVLHVRIGSEVVVNPSLRWLYSADVPKSPEIVGSPSDGTFAESIIVPVGNIEPKPAYLTWEEAGVLPLSALTAYRALFTRGQLKAGEHVLVPGIGSGVATFVLLMAKAAGAYVTVTSRSIEKRERALKLGADAAIDSSWEEGAFPAGERVDLIIDSVGPAMFPRYMSALRSGGRIVNFGATTGDQVQLSLRPFFYSQFSLLGTSMGSREEFRDMLAFIAKHQIRPVIDRVYPLEAAVEAFQRMEEGQQFGKIGLRIE